MADEVYDGAIGIDLGTFSARSWSLRALFWRPIMLTVIDHQAPPTPAVRFFDTKSSNGSANTIYTGY